MPDKLLDTRGHACPIPVLKAKRAMRDVPPGGTLEVLADDPLAPADFDVLCQAGGHTMEQSGEKDGVYRFIIRRCDS